MNSLFPDDVVDLNCPELKRDDVLINLHGLRNLLQNGDVDLNRTQIKFNFRYKVWSILN